MAYTPANLSMLVDIIAGGTAGRRFWVYHSTDPATTVDDSGYFTTVNKTHGMQEGDIVFVFDTDSDPPDATIMYCSVINSTTKDGTCAALVQGTTPSVTSLVTASLTVSTSAMIGDAAGDLIGFYGGAGVSQRASSVQATSNIASSTDFGATQLALVQEIMNTLTGLKLWKGSA